MQGLQDGRNAPYHGSNGKWALWLREQKAGACITDYRLALAYRDVLSADKTAKLDGRTAAAKRGAAKSATLSTKRFASWSRGQVPGPPVAWRIGDALAESGVPVTGLDGIIAAGYEREAVGLIGAILGRWRKDHWEKLDDADAVKRGLGLVAARAVGFQRLVERPIPRKDAWGSFAIDDDDPQSAETVLYDYYSKNDLLPGIFEQEQDNEESLRALVACREKLADAWAKWREQKYKIEDAFPEYVAAYQVMSVTSLNNDVGKRAARDILVSYGFGVTVFEEDYGEVIDPRFPHFEIIADQMQEEPMGVPRMGYTRIGNRFA